MAQPTDVKKITQHSILHGKIGFKNQDPRE
jgi:hypothetical protein